MWLYMCPYKETKFILINPLHFFFLNIFIEV